jgi:hypothetical protein
MAWRAILFISMQPVMLGLGFLLWPQKLFRLDVWPFILRLLMGSQLMVSGPIGVSVSCGSSSASDLQSSDFSSYETAHGTPTCSWRSRR